MNNSNSHNTPQLIHAAVELVVGACITFWLNRKISKVSQKVSLLEDKLKFYENILGQHHELIKKLFSAIGTTAERGPVPSETLSGRGTGSRGSKILHSFANSDSTAERSLDETAKTDLGAIPDEVRRGEVDFDGLGTLRDASSHPAESGRAKRVDNSDELDDILSAEIKDLRIDQTGTLA